MPETDHISEGMKAIIELSATRAAQEVIRQHRADCNVVEISREIWGNGKPGLKADLQEMRSELKDMRGRKAWLGKIMQSIVTAVGVAMVFWLSRLWKET